MQWNEVWGQPPATTDDNAKGDERSQLFQQKVWKGYEQMVIQSSG